ncbi:hypothetical protein KAW96_04830 [candidate division WOR-3 bacterium]|nr:hypothetical protein [candidate division WOR-3 bacterium]
MKYVVMLLITLLFVSCCRICGPDTEPPAVPRGVISITGDERIYIQWYPNSEKDLAGYNVYRGYSAVGYFDLIETVSTEYFVDYYVTNGVTYYYAVSAFDEAGNESDLSPDLVYDTPRPEGTDMLRNYLTDPNESGFDFSMESVIHYDNSHTDIYYEYDTTYGVHYMNCADGTDIQDFGYTDDLDDINYAPEQGWSYLGWVELIVGHGYIVWTRDDHFAKFRIIELGNGWCKFDWAYQVDKGNRELALPPGEKLNQLKNNEKEGGKDD